MSLCSYAFCFVAICSDQTRLNDLEDAAKAAGKGKWAKENDANMQRDIKWSVENPRNFVDSLHQKPVEGI